MFLDLQTDIILFLQEWSNPFTDAFFNAVSFLGEPEFYILLLGFIYWVYNKRLGEFLALTLGVSISLNNALKEVFMIERPFQAYAEVENMREATATGSAFPSGHAQGSSTVFFGIARFYDRMGLYFGAAILAVLMALSRMFLGVHYLQDVLGGTLVGIVLAFAIYAVYQRLADHPERLHWFYLGVIIVLFPGIFLIEGNDFFRGYGILVGFALAVAIEKRHVRFTLGIPWFKKILRYALGIVFMLLIMVGLGELFERFGFDDGSLGANLLDFVRFFAVAFGGFGLYPPFFKRFRF